MANKITYSNVRLSNTTNLKTIDGTITENNANVANVYIDSPANITNLNS